MRSTITLVHLSRINLFALLCYNRVDMTIYSSYDPFAWIYNKHWGNSFLPVVLPILDNLALHKLPKNARILDLCCGTGQMAQQLKTMGYRVTGIDGSPEMLSFARENAPDVEFLQADARSFELPLKYHAVISVFDSLNHIMSTSDLKSVFVQVYQALRSGGLFMFDLNTEPGYFYEWNGDFSIIEDDHVCVIRNTYNQKSRIAVFDATIFRLKDDSWYRHDITLYQKCHVSAAVKSALKSAGFTNIEIYGFDWQSGVRKPDKDARRAFFLCHKPKNV
jgi:SAM-dependent methyltransferase